MITLVPFVFSWYYLFIDYHRTPCTCVLFHFSFFVKIGFPPFHLSWIEYRQASRVKSEGVWNTYIAFSVGQKMTTNHPTFGSVHGNTHTEPTYRNHSFCTLHVGNLVTWYWYQQQSSSSWRLLALGIPWNGRHSIFSRKDWPGSDSSKGSVVSVVWALFYWVCCPSSPC